MGIEINYNQIPYEEAGCPRCGEGTGITSPTAKIWQCEKCGTAYDKKPIAIIDVVVRV